MAGCVCAQSTDASACQRTPTRRTRHSKRRTSYAPRPPSGSTLRWRRRTWSCGSSRTCTRARSRPWRPPPLARYVGPPVVSCHARTNSRGCAATTGPGAQASAAAGNAGGSPPGSHDEAQGAAAVRRTRAEQGGGQPRRAWRPAAVGRATRGCTAAEGVGHVGVPDAYGQGAGIASDVAALAHVHHVVGVDMSRLASPVTRCLSLRRSVPVARARQPCRPLCARQAPSSKC